MIGKLQTYEGGSFDPYLNLATEQHLLETVEGGCCLLYLWQNENTVVIGRNQNPWAECNASLLEEEGGHLARRLSGGGAVFHDLGNLNFTFLVPAEDYDLEKQQRVLLTACQSFGVPAELSGRNDLMADGRKFSGNAFYRSGNRSYHHGTLLVDVDGKKLSRYLTPSKAKLEAKGVPSVRSRVVNLKELCPKITVEELKKALNNAFEKVYGHVSTPKVLRDADKARIAELRKTYASWEWRFGQKLPFTLRCEARFVWGGADLMLDVNKGVIQGAKLYTDAMDDRLPSLLETAVTGRNLEREDIRRALEGSGIAADLQADLFGLIVSVI